MLRIDNVFEGIFLGGFIVGCIIRTVYTAGRRRDKAAKRRRSLLDISLIGLATVGLVAPLVYLFTGWLDFADYRLPAQLQWTGWVGAAAFGAALLLLWRSHADLARNWSAIPAIKEGHSLVTTGVYRHVRHPMYTAHLLWGVAQALLLGNYLAGPALLAGLIIFCLVRIPLEEKMMLEHFGDDYRSYIARTGRLFPKLRNAIAT
jgi:protein-S-isoprenylcysteine O-methyltransferase Ste14